jgi:DNA phosphorothioation-associated putative methyltransferase
LTEEAERLGLLDNVGDFGTKIAWRERLARIGLGERDNKLVPVDESGRTEAEPAAVFRHRTALTRYSLSAPMQLLWKFGYLNGAYSIFDYGCGRGDDVRALLAQGLNAGGWDPFFAADASKQRAKVVNLGYVLNVIEDVAERAAALLGAWSLAETVLAVSVLIGGRTEYERQRLFRDGVLTARGTFQKYYSQAELRAYLEGELGREPIAVAPGVFLIFRTDEAEQRFLAARQALRVPTVPLPSVPRGPRDFVPREPRGLRAPRALLSPLERLQAKLHEHQALVDEFWATCLRMGRIPDDREFSRAPEVCALFRSSRSLFKKIVAVRGGDEFELASEMAKADLQVYLALNAFERRRSFGTLPEEHRRAVRAFWGSYRTAVTEAQRLLFSVGQPETIRAACRAASARGLGFLEDDRALYVRASTVPYLPQVLRVYVSCAARFYGEVENADLVKIHADSGKVTLLLYDDFEGKPIPLLLERVKVDLREQDIHFFEYGSAASPQALYLKSRFLMTRDPLYDHQRAFDGRLLALGQFNFSGFGPAYEDVTKQLQALSSHDNLEVPSNDHTLRDKPLPRGRLFP